MSRITVFFVFESRGEAAVFDQRLRAKGWETDEDVTSPRHVELRLDATHGSTLPTALARLAGDAEAVMAENFG